MNQPNNGFPGQQFTPNAPVPQAGTFPQPGQTMQNPQQYQQQYPQQPAQHVPQAPPAAGYPAYPQQQPAAPGPVYHGRR